MTEQKQQPRYFATVDGQQVVVDKSPNPDVSWYEHKAAREVVLAEVDDVVIAAKDLPEVTASEVMASLSAGGSQMSWDDESLERAERYVGAYAAFVRFLRAEKAQKERAAQVEALARAHSNANVLAGFITSPVVTFDNIEDLGLDLARAGYKIVKED